MNNFEDMAADLTSTVRDIQLKKQTLGKQIAEDETQIEDIEAELQIMIERKKEIQTQLKSYKIERK